MPNTYSRFFVAFLFFCILCVFTPTRGMTQSADEYNDSGLAWYDRGEYDKAIADFNEAVRLDPNFEAAYNNRGLALNAKGEYRKALVDLNRALEINPQDEYAYNNRSWTWNGLGEYDKSIADYNEALRLSPNFARAYRRLAWLQATCPDPHYRDAKSAFMNANRAYALCNGKTCWYFDALAAAYAENGDFDRAREYADKAVGLAFRGKDKEEIRERLELYKQNKPYRETIKGK